MTILAVEPLISKVNLTDVTELWDNFLPNSQILLYLQNKSYMENVQYIWLHTI